MKPSYNVKLFVTFLTVLFVFSVAWGEDTRIEPTDDSFVYTYTSTPGVYDDVNYNEDATGLRIRSGSSTLQGHWRRVFLKFQIGDLFPEDVGTVRLKLTLHRFYNQIATMDGIYQIFAVENTSWDETTINWTNQPERGKVLATQSNRLNQIAATNPDTTLFYDITAYILEQLDLGSEWITLMLDDSTETGVGDGSGVDARFYSKELEEQKPDSIDGDPDNSPYLLITASNAIESVNALPRQFTLRQNYPNPFNPSTFIDFSIQEKAFIEMNIYNVLGIKVKTLLQKNQNAGSYSVVWDGSDSWGNAVPAGIYFCKLTAGNYQRTIKMAFVK